jgi:hypothetical protein
MASYLLDVRESGCFQLSSLRHFTLGDVTPKGDWQLAGQRNNRDPPNPPARSFPTRARNQPLSALPG